MIFNIVFHPLRNIPGPKGCAVSRIPYTYHHLNGTNAAFLRKLHDQYGEVVRYSPNELSFISGETAWNDIYGFRTGALKGHANMNKDPAFFEDPPNRATSIISADDENHARGRRILAHAFSSKALSNQETLIQTYGNLLIDGLTETAANSGKYVDVVRWYNWTTFDVIADLLFGEPFGCLQERKTHDFVQLLLTTVKSFHLIYVNHYYPWARKLGSLIVDNAQLVDGQRFFKWVADQVAKRYERGTLRPDLMTEILNHNNHRGQGLSEPEIISNVTLFLGAGTETTATALSAATYLLCQYPAKLRILQDEVRGLWKSSDLITFEQVSNAAYLQAVISEALRLFPPVAAGVARKVPKGGEFISGYFIPEHTSVSVSSFPTGRSGRNFADPDKFVPERWLGDARYKNDKTQSLNPFSHGPRNCLGKVHFS